MAASAPFLNFLNLTFEFGANITFEFGTIFKLTKAF